jgi:hypothetical protein
MRSKVCCTVIYALNYDIYNKYLLHRFQLQCSLAHNFDIVILQREHMSRDAFSNPFNARFETNEHCYSNNHGLN